MESTKECPPSPQMVKFKFQLIRPNKLILIQPNPYAYMRVFGQTQHAYKSDDHVKMINRSACHTARIVCYISVQIIHFSNTKINKVNTKKLSFNSYFKFSIALKSRLENKD